MLQEIAEHIIGYPKLPLYMDAVQETMRSRAVQTYAKCFL
jgi:hypothetical protein